MNNLNEPRIKKFFKLNEENSQEVLFTGEFMQVSFPNYYFEKKLANQLGNVIETIGLFNFIIFDNSNKNKKICSGKFTLPTIIRLKPSAISSVLESNLDDDNENSNDNEEDDTDELSTEKYFVMDFLNNDVFIENIYLTEQKVNVDNFLKTILNGKLLKNIKYEDIPKLIFQNAKLNNIDYGVGSLVVEMVVSELCRNPNNLEQAYRFIAGLDNNEINYKMINIKRIAQFNSTFTAVTFEDMQTALTMAVNKNRSKKKEMESPMEKILYM